MIKIEFPSDRPDIALAIGGALVAIAGNESHDVAPQGQEPSGFAEQVVAKAEAHDVPNEKPAAGTVAAAGEDGKVEATTPLAASHADAPLDPNGVPFDVKYCASAKDPFYATGKRAGQWKKRKGVSEEDYDVWYASVVPQPRTTPVVETAVDTGSAFGAQTDAPETAPETAPAPTDAGELMGWVAEMQAAERLSLKAVDMAYKQTGVCVQDLFGSASANAVAAVYAVLAPWAAE